VNFPKYDDLDPISKFLIRRIVMVGIALGTAGLALLIVNLPLSDQLKPNLVRIVFAAGIATLILLAVKLVVRSVKRLRGEG
jgi:hypothetical protein